MAPTSTAMTLNYTDGHLCCLKSFLSLIYRGM